jgi:hypothetical protein
MLEKLLMDEDSLLLARFISISVVHLFIVGALCTRASPSSSSLQLSKE